MEEQTAQSDVRNGLQNDIPRLQSMLAKLNLKHKHPKTVDVKLHPDTVGECMSCNSLEPEGSITNEEVRKDSTVRSDGDGEQATRSSDTEDRSEAVEELSDVFPKWERKSLLSNDLPIQTQVAEVTWQPSESESLEDKKNKEIEEHVAGALLLTNSPSQETSAHTSYLSVSLDRVDSEQVGLKHEPLDEACGGPSKPVSIDMSSVLTHQPAVNVTGKTTRSASDPVTPNKPKEKRPLSAPSISNLGEYENMEPAKNFGKAAKILGQDNSDASIGNVTKTQKKGVKNKMKHFTQKLMVRLKEKSYCEHTGSISTQDNLEEEEGQNLNCSMVEAEARDIPPPLPPKKGKYVLLDRRFTLKDFRLNLEPINLMEEIFTSSEWLSYLPIKESPAEKGTSDQPNDVLLPEKAIQLDVPLLTPKQEQSEDIKTPEEDIKKPKQEQSEEIKAPEQDIKISKQDQSDNIKLPKQEQTEDIQAEKDRKTPKQEQPEDIKTPEEDIKAPKQEQSEDLKTTENDRKTSKQNQSADMNDNQDHASDPQEYNLAKVNGDLDVKQVERDPKIFAIPKALLTKNPVQPRAYMSNKSDDIYDSVDMYIIPKNDIPLRKRKALDAPLDFSAVKSSQLLDNSALKGRIRLSKKRHHRPPKNHQKVMLSAVFYNIPPVILKGASPPRHIPFSTSPPLHLPSRP